MGGYLVAILLFVISIGGAYLVYKMINQMAGGAIGKAISKGVSMAVGAAGGAAGFALRKVGMNRTADHMDSATKVAQSGASGDIQGALNSSREAAGNAVRGSLLAKGLKKTAQTGVVQNLGDAAQDFGSTSKAVGKSIVTGNIFKDIASDESIQKGVFGRDMSKESTKAAKLGKRREKRENKLLENHGGIDRDHLMGLRDNHGLELYKWGESGKMVDGGVFNKDGSISIDGLSKIQAAQSKSAEGDAANVKKVEDEVRSSKRERGEEDAAGKARVTSEDAAGNRRLTEAGTIGDAKINEEEGIIADAKERMKGFKGKADVFLSDIKNMQNGDETIAKAIKEMLNDDKLKGIHEELERASKDWVNASVGDLDVALKNIPVGDSVAREALEKLIESKKDLNNYNQKASETKEYIESREPKMAEILKENKTKKDEVVAKNKTKKKDLERSSDSKMASLAGELGVDNNGSIKELVDVAVKIKAENAKRSFDTLKGFGVEINHQHDHDGGDEIAQVAEAYKKSIDRMVAGAAIEEASKKSLEDAKKMAEK